MTQAYKEHLISKGQDGSSLDFTIELVTHTANAISLFKDKQVISSGNDCRLQEMKQFLLFLQKWKCNLAHSESGVVK